ncbi:MAG: glycerol-3-phosphate dehydrogenase [Hyphomicrobium sp.]
MANDIFDVLVIGGGVNGAGVAADAAGRGLKVLLAEADDLAGATSSASSKLVHGGLRYLEHYAFRLVRAALAEREVLLANAPHIVWPMRFVLPHAQGMRPAWTLGAGLFLYDHLAKRRTLGRSRRLRLNRDSAGRALSTSLRRGFSFWDCWVDDARLVVLNAIAARDAGAVILTRTPVTGLRAETGVWLAQLGGAANGHSVAARAVVNAAGPWVAGVAGLALAGRNRPPLKLRLVKGSHIVVPRIAGADDAYVFQAPDGRVVFALPFEGRFTLIGTTDEAYAGDPRDAAASSDEIAYLLDVANAMFRAPLTSADIVWSFAGVRPLDDDGSDAPSEVSRDYRLQFDKSAGAPLLNVIGGKITTYRRLAEQALRMLGPYFPAMGAPFTARVPLPGGDVGPGGFDRWFEAFASGLPGFPPEALHRFARRYGTRTPMMLGGARSMADMGPHLGGGLTTREVAYLKAEEWAQTAEDVMWRRTKTGLLIPPKERGAARAAIQAALAYA